MCRAAAILLSAFLLLVPEAFAETTGSINISTQGNISATTGVYGYTVFLCNSTAQCFDYKCFGDFDGVSASSSSGWCNQTAVTDCFNNVRSYGKGVVLCITNATYRTCNAAGSGVWSDLQTCSSGQTCNNNGTTTGCTAASSSSTTTSGTSSSGTTTRALSTGLSVTSQISDFEIVQGEIATKIAVFKNTGNVTLSNVSLSLSGIDKGWFGSDPPYFTGIDPLKENQFNVTFFVPGDAAAQAYQVTADITTNRANVSARFAFTIKVSPSNDTVKNSILPKYSKLVSLLQEVEQNITSASSRGVDHANISEFRNRADKIKSLLNQINSSLEKKDYFSPVSLLADAEKMLGDLGSSVAAAAPAEQKQADILPLALITALIIGMLFVMYLMWPKKAPVRKE